MVALIGLGEAWALALRCGGTHTDLAPCPPTPTPGLSLLSALWVPNVEFMFGLTGATASVMLSYVLPPIILLRLMDNCPELSDKVRGGGGGKGQGATASFMPGAEWGG